jgi:hypothetical protein
MGWRETTLTILSGATESEVLNLEEKNARRKKNFTFINPAALTGTVTVHLADKVGGTFRAYNDGFGNDIVLIANKAQLVNALGAGALKLVSGSAEAADRVFIVRGLAES